MAISARMILRAFCMAALCCMVIPLSHAEHGDVEVQGGREHGARGAVGSTAGLRNDLLKAPRVSMGTINTVNRLMEPLPQPWPRAFSVSFYTNISAPIAESDEERGSEVQHAISGKLYYEEGKGQLVFHGAGSEECVKFYSIEDEGCSLVFNADGMFAKAAPPINLCCLDIPGLHAPPANWTTAAPHKFIGTKRVRGRMCHGFSYSEDEGKREETVAHEYWQDSKTKLPCAFSFQKDPKMNWFFDLSTFEEGTQEASLFVVPQQCYKTCASSSRRSMQSHSTILPASWGGNKEFHKTVEQVVDMVKEALERGEGAERGEREGGRDESEAGRVAEGEREEKD